MVENVLANQTVNRDKQDVISTKNKTDSRNLGPKQKVAIVVVSLGADRTSQIYKYLNEQDIEDLTYEVAKMGKTINSQVKRALDEFYKLCLTHRMTTDGGLDYVRDVLEKAPGKTTARSFPGKVSKTLQSRSFNFFMKGDPRVLLPFPQRERPQVIALIMSYMDLEQAVRVLEQLLENERAPAMEDMAKTDRVFPEAVAIVEEEMKRKFVIIITSEDNTNLDGVDYVADVMNHVDRSNGKRIFDELDKRNLELSRSIRDKMFVFESILDMGDHLVQCFIRDCDIRGVMYTLKSVLDEMQQTFFTNISKRTTETVCADLEITANVRMKDMEEVQQCIVSIIRRLEDTDEVVINKGGEGDNIFIQRHRPFR